METTEPVKPRTLLHLLAKGPHNTAVSIEIEFFKEKPLILSFYGFVIINNKCENSESVHTRRTNTLVE